MKTIYNNEAIGSYLEFVNRVVKNKNTEETKIQYERFVELFNQYMTDEIRHPIFDGYDIESYGNVKIEIEYNGIEQIWAIIHYCLNKIIGMEDYSPDGIYLNTSFTDYTLEDVNKIGESLAQLWYLTDSPAYIIHEPLWIAEKEPELTKEQFHTILAPESECYKLMDENNSAIIATEFTEEMLDEIKTEKSIAFTHTVSKLVANIYGTLNLSDL
ncbi:hypothetical protein [Treponema ruminis]|uniref:Uncharacterized protein n=1 Tax=Treponema ruminis TaxID=744515 RepID=A0A7W8G719_9SPIR|nr:hypothetical protein [Treponema ruminis]MBB5224967.1 hypothetical protein [Treponema ruminis]